jgi:antitoxin (DNA-binding transcriptional repressor) of toxin-antitoxin stability system
MTVPSGRPTDISVRQFVADSGAVTRGLRQVRAYTLTLNGEPLARMIPIRQRRAVPKDPLPYDQGAARFYGQICAAVRAIGREPRRRASDLMIAATAASNQLPLYTANPGDFKGVVRPGKSGGRYICELLISLPDSSAA